MLNQTKAVDDETMGARTLTSFGSETDLLPQQEWQQLIEFFSTPIFLVDRHSRLQFANPAAVEVMRQGCGLTFADQIIKPTNPCARRAWNEWIHKASRGLPRTFDVDFDHQTMTISLLPVSSAQPSRQQVELGHVWLVCGKTHAVEPSEIDTLMQRFALTRTEARVVIAAMQGESALVIAKKHHVSENTIRTHLSNIRSKLGCSTLRQVTDRIRGLPPIRPMFLAV